MSIRNFGLPYTGSKSRIAPWLMEMLPSCENFVDVFAGGCAVSHAVMLYGKAKTITMNDLQGDVVQLFLDALHGDLQKYNPYKWVDRTTFFEQKDKNPFIRLVYSFGNRGWTYLYSREIEEYKYAVHLALTENDWAALSELCPDLSERCKTELLNYPNDNDDYSSSIEIRHSIFKKKCCDLLRELSNNNWKADIIQQNPFYKMSSKKEWISHGKTGTKIVGVHGSTELFRIDRIKRIKQVEVLERTKRIKLITNDDIISNNPVINTSSVDYKLLDIPNNSIIFCDPPYKDSDIKYNNTKFNHEEFYEWCLEKAKHNQVYVTEYNIDHSHFQLMGEKGRQISFNGQGSKGMKIEKLYKVIP